MNLRAAQRSDAAALARMNGELIRDEGHRNPMSVAELEARMAKWLEGEYQAVLFEEDGTALGYALFKREPEWVYLRQFFVARGRRRKGIGREALRRLRAEVWKDAPRIRLDVLTGNASGIAFWRAMGFQDYCLTMEKRS
jgi:GNAT superfamily N-acetyltransferase